MGHSAGQLVVKAQCCCCTDAMELHTSRVPCSVVCTSGIHGRSATAFSMSFMNKRVWGNGFSSVHVDALFCRHTCSARQPTLPLFRRQRRSASISGAFAGAVSIYAMMPLAARPTLFHASISRHAHGERWTRLLLI